MAKLDLQPYNAPTHLDLQPYNAPSTSLGAPSFGHDFLNALRLTSPAMEAGQVQRAAQTPGALIAGHEAVGGALQGIEQPVTHLMHVPTPPLLSPQESQSFPAEAGRFASQTAEFSPLAEASILPEASRLGEDFLASKGLSPEVSRAISKILTPAAIQSTAGAITSPHHPIEGAIGGGLSGILHYPASQLMPKVLAPIKSYMRKLASSDSISPEKLKPTLDALPTDFHPSLGDLVQNQKAGEHYAGTLRQIPFTGVENSLKNMRDSIDSHAHGLIESLRGGVSPEDVDSTLKSQINTISVNNWKDSRGEFNNLTQAADNAGVKITPTQTKATAKKLLKLEKGKILKDMPTNISSQLGQLSKVKIAGQRDTEMKMISSPFGRVPLIEPKKEVPVPFQNFKNAQKAHSALGATGRDLLSAQNFSGARNVWPVKDALHNDMTDAINNSRDSSLIDQWSDANDKYKKKVLPYLNERLIKMTSGDRDPKGLSNLLGEDSDDMNLIRQQLPESGRNLLGYSHIRKAIKATGVGDEATAEGLWGKYKQIDNAKRDRLFTGEQQKSFNTLGAMLNSTKEARLSLNKPATGFRNKESIVKGLLGGSGLAALSYLSPHTAAALAGGTLLGSRLMSKYLTSPKAVEDYLTSGLRSPLERLMPRVGRVGRTAFTPTITNTQGNQ